jgi:hypothetical protein
MSGSNCTHGIPAGLPCGIPGIGEVIEGAMQHAPHPVRQSMPDDYPQKAQKAQNKTVDP